MASKIGIITPILIQNERVLNLYLSNLATYNSSCKTHIFAICNKLYIDKNELLNKIKESIKIDSEVTVFQDKERSVAGAWNKGIQLALDNDIDVFHIISQDVALHPNCLDILIGNNLPIVSSIDNSQSIGQKHKFNSCDFSSVMIQYSTIQKYGWFDREYKPAYFEDNDYVTRMVSKNDFPVADCAAIHYTPGSCTIRLDGEAAHHVNHWNPQNRQRYISKWGVDTGNSYEQLRDKCNKFPFKVYGKDVSWWLEQSKSGYDVGGGIHE